MNKIHLKKQFETKINHFKLEVDFSFDNGQIVGLFGPSGSGKTTTLRLIAGLMKPDDGKVHIHDELWYDKTTSLDIKVQKRSLGYMFQESALFPNMTVLQNLEFALKSKEDLDIIYEVVEVMSLDSLLPLKPNALSGGQKQRVALARAIVRKPNILLLDEPFSSMDQKLKYDLLDYLLEVHSRYRPSIIVVSHDQKEIEKLCDIVYIIDKGAIVNSGKPEHVFDNKATKFEMIIVEKKSENNSYVFVVNYKGADIDINVDEEVFKNKEVGDSVEVILGVS